MPLPQPRPGLVFKYAYLWRSEAELGLVEGLKDRPCAVVVVVRRDGDTVSVVVAPITNSMPMEGSGAIELPARVKLRLGLDGARSWNVTVEANVFVWPGHDLRPMPEEAYGDLPRGLTVQVIERFREQMTSDVRMLVPRDGPRR